MKCSLDISNFLEEISNLSHFIVFLYFFALITGEGFLISPFYSLELCIQMDISFLSPLLFPSLLFTTICKASSDSHFAFLNFFFLGMILIPVSYTMSQISIHNSSWTPSDLIPWIYFSLPLYNDNGFDLGHTWMVSDAKSWLIGKDSDAGKNWWQEEKGDDRGWDGWMASSTQWTWVWVDSGCWWWTGRPGVLWFMGPQRVGRNWVTELNWTEWSRDFPYFLQFKSEFGNKEFMNWAWSCFCWLYKASPSLAAKNIINLILVLTIWWCPCIDSSLVLLEEGVCYDQCYDFLKEVAIIFITSTMVWLKVTNREGTQPHLSTEN